MAFVIPDLNNCDLVTFYMRKDFSDYPRIISHYVDRHDPYALLYYINEYMDTNVVIRRPDTPTILIMNKPPAGYYPLY
jgi:hypothetical protein